MAYLEVCNLKKDFNGKVILDDINFKLEKKETLCIIGNSGSGKTTLLKILAFIEEVKFGIISLDDEIMINNVMPSSKQLAKKRKSIGFVFQGYNLFSHLSVRNNLLLPIKEKVKEKVKQEIINPLSFKQRRRLYKKYLSEEIKYLDYLVESLNIKNILNQYPITLSGGEAQRVAIARALALKPKIVLFDEPTSALDPKLKKTVTEAILLLKEMGITIIVVTHEMAFAKSVADKVIYMEEGRIIETGDCSILNNPKTKLLSKFLQ